MGSFAQINLLDPTVLAVQSAMLSLDSDELAAIRVHASTASRQNIQLSQTVRWIPWALTTSAKQTYDLYNDPITYGSGVSYGVGTRVGWLMPQGISDVKVITSRLTNGHVLVAGVDFTIESGILWFKVDPFTVSWLTPEGTDPTVNLWIYQGSIPDNGLYSLYGFPFGMPNTQATPQIKAAVNAGWDAVTGGWSDKGINQFLSAAFDTPVAKTNETVVLLTTSGDGHPVVVTDQSAYRLGKKDKSNWAVGQTIPAGSFVGTAVVSTIMSQAALSGSVPGLTINTIPINTPAGEIYLQNASLSFYTTVVDGVTRYRFTMYGEPAAIDWWWNTVDAATDASGISLLEWVLQRSDNPPVSAMPATINPVQAILPLIGNWRVYQVFIDLIGDNPIPGALFNRVWSESFPTYAGYLLQFMNSTSPVPLVVSAGTHVLMAENYSVSNYLPGLLLTAGTNAIIVH